MINLIKKYKFAIGIVSILLLLFLFRHFIIIHKDFFEIIFKTFTVIIACLALSTWKKNLNFKKEVEVLNNVIDQCDKYIRRRGYPNPEFLYDIALNIEKDKHHFSQTKLGQLKILHNKLIKYCDILVRDKYIKRGKFGERLEENPEISELIPLDKEIYDLFNNLKEYAINKINASYDINL